MLTSAAQASLRGDFDAQHWRAQAGPAKLTHKGSSREAGPARAGSCQPIDCWLIPMREFKETGMWLFVCRLLLSHTVIREI